MNLKLINKLTKLKENKEKNFKLVWDDMKIDIMN